MDALITTALPWLPGAIIGFCTAFKIPDTNSGPSTGCLQTKHDGPTLNQITLTENENASESEWSPLNPSVPWRDAVI